MHSAGLECLSLSTALLQRVRLAHPTVGIWEAADVQWWWGRPRSSDSLEQTFWVDADGPVALALLTEFDAVWQLDLIVVPDRGPTLLRVAWKDALQRLSQLRVADVEVLANDDDELSLGLLAEAGFSPGPTSGGATWMPAADVPSPPELPDSYRFTDRTVRSSGAHWLASRNGAQVEARLHQCSLYDPELDLAVETFDGDIAAYALFWFDPVTTVGMIEPMRTEDAHQRLGLARALIGEGLNRLVGRGANRMKVGYSTGAARALYINSGFAPTDTHLAYRRQWD